MPGSTYARLRYLFKSPVLTGRGARHIYSSSIPEQATKANSKNTGKFHVSF